MGSSRRLLARALIRSLAPRQPSPNACLLNSRVNAGQLRSFSRGVETGGVQSLDQETERKAGWMLKALAAVTFTYVGLNVFPLMGDNLVKHSVRLLRTKDPLFRRSGASRLTLIATDDERRLKIVDAGGVGALVDMLQTASDDDTRREAAKALATLSECDAAVEELHKTGVQPLVDTLSTSSSDSETQQHSLFLLERLQEWRTRTSSG
ncbi:unnamed protein product [Calypogeia fissa]